MEASSDTQSESDCENILPTTVGIPEEQSLRHIIRTRFPNGMPEDFIAVIMRDVLKGLNFLHVSVSAGHKDVNSSNICVDTEQLFTTIKLAAHPGKHLVYPGPEWRQGRNPTEGIWGLGITALEMGFGSLPRKCSGNADLVSLANNVIRILKLKLDYPEEKGEEKAKNEGKDELAIDDDQEMKEKAMQKGKEKLITDDDQEIIEKAMEKGKEKLELAGDQEMKEKAMQKGKEKLELDDDQEMKEKAMEKGKEKLELDDDQEMKERAMQKGKEKLELGDDPKGEEVAKQKGRENLEVSDDQELKEKATQKGKEKLEIADEELKKSTIKLPVLERLRNISDAESPEKKKKAMAALTEKFKKAMKFFRKKKNDDAAEREFSRDFLEVVLMCLEEQRRTTAKQILKHPFFLKPIDLQKFEHSMRSRYFRG